MTITTTTHLDNYNLEVELSRNGWSIVYWGRRKTDGAVVTVKVVAPLFGTDEYFVRRFKYTAQQCAQLEHPNILRTYEAEEEAGQLYLVQDFVEVRTMAQVIEAEGPFSPQRTQFIAAQIASALDYAHQKSITHGDLSAQHIYLGSNDHVWLTDFGQSQILFGTNLAESGLVGSSCETLAPERARGEGPSRQADLYSLGVLCYQMLAGRLPFSGPSSTVLHAQAYRQPRPLHRVNPGISVALSEAVGRMLSKNPELRFNTAAEFARALAVAGQPTRSLRSFDNLLPLEERERRRAGAGRRLLYYFVGLVGIGVVSILSLWTGYELGLKHAAPEPSLVQRIVDPAGETLQVITDSGRPNDLHVPAATSTPVPQAAVATSPKQPDTFSDRLKATPGQPTSARPTPTTRPTSTPTAGPTLVTLDPLPVSNVVAAPVTLPSAIPVGQGRFVFHNPTGHDLVVDLTGSSIATEVVPPYQDHEFFLKPGPYQYIIHTPTGKHLAAKVGTFDLAVGQTIETDYHSRHDATIVQN